ncbi:hypothetical protein DPMN_043529 [Dreissena polymorpha]|uniref:Uncharacterized protein n=1 Tax=Dreissena polymorpha TaxID=45954 RepID=A0A9D4D453_DREPO|nr:hypothetical protein DPMN_043529 [Dreissena polymorpha]
MSTSGTRLVRPQEPLLATVNRQNLACFGHVTMHKSLCKTVIHGDARDKSTSRPSEEKLDGQCERGDIPSHG